MGTQLPLKGAQPPVFGPRLLWPNGWMDEMPLGTEVDLGPGHIALDGDPGLPMERGTAPPLFGPCLLLPRSPISAITAVHVVLVSSLLFLFGSVRHGTLISWLFISCWAHVNTVHRIVGLLLVFHPKFGDVPIELDR